MKPILSAGLLMLVAAAICPGAHAQQFQNQIGSPGTLGGMGSIGGTPTQFGGTSGAFGSRSLGGTLSGGQRTFAGGSGGAAGGVGQGMGLANQTSVGQVSGNERFLRDNRQGQFVGSDSADARNFIGAISQLQQASGRGALGGFGSSRRDDDNRDRDDDNGFGGTQRVPIRRTYRVDFEVTPVAAPAIESRLAAQLSRSRGLNALGPIAVRMEGRTAILRGVVPTDRARVLAEQMALLEVGVSRVQNELTVVPPPVPEELPSPAPAAGN